MSHRFQPETTNGGNCFSDCRCGWSGGVYPTRTDAKIAWHQHSIGEPVPAPIKPAFLIGGPIAGRAGDTDD